MYASSSTSQEELEQGRTESAARGLPYDKMAPKGWSNFTPDVKLLLLETVATTLALKDGLALDRLDILDT